MRLNGNKAAAETTLERVLTDEPANVAALMERADLHTDEPRVRYRRSSRGSEAKPGEKTIMSRLAYVLQQAGKSEEAMEVAKSAGLEVPLSGDGKGGVVGTPEEIEAANSSDPAVARKALEKLLEEPAQRDAVRTSRCVVSHGRSRALA